MLFLNLTPHLQIQLDIMTVDLTDTSSSTSTSQPELLLTWLMEDSFNIAMIVVTLILSLVAIILNFFVMRFNRKDFRTKIISFIYCLLSLSDFCTGLCALLHTLMFAVMMEMKSDMTIHIIWLVVPAHFFTSVAFKGSAFVSVTFAVIRTINILDPFRLVKKRKVVIATAAYTVLWACVFAVDMAIYMKNSKAGGGVDRLMELFWNPGKSMLMEYLSRKYRFEDSAIPVECLGDCLYTIGPVFFCSLIALIATVIQLVFLWLPSRRISQSETNTANERRGISITIMMITLLFIICAGVTLYGPHQVCAHPAVIRDRRMFYAAGYLPFFINAALNPLILVFRVRSFRAYLRHQMQGIDHFNSRVSKMVNTSVISYLTRTKTVDTEETDC